MPPMTPAISTIAHKAHHLHWQKWHAQDVPSSGGLLLEWRGKLLSCWTAMCKVHRGVQLDWIHRAGRDMLNCIYADTPWCSVCSTKPATAFELMQRHIFLITLIISFQQRDV